MEPAVNAVAPSSTGALKSQPKDAAARVEAAPEDEEQSFSSVLESRVGAQPAEEPGRGAAAEESEPAVAAAAELPPVTAAAPDPSAVLAALGLGTTAAVLVSAQPRPAAAETAAPVMANLAAAAAGAADAPADDILVVSSPPAGSAASAEPAGERFTAASRTQPDAAAGPTAILAAPGKDGPSAEAPVTAASAQAQPAVQGDGTNALPPPGPIAGGIAAPTARPAQELPAVSVPARLGSAEWDGQFAQRVAWVAGERLHVAEIHINPPELGPVEIKLTLSESQATLAFVSQHAPVREAIESALPRLREVLAGSGIMLGQSSVSDQPLQRDSGAQWNGGGRQQGERPAGFGAGDGVPAGLVRGYRVGMLDVFA